MGSTHDENCKISKGFIVQRLLVFQSLSFLCAQNRLICSFISLIDCSTTLFMVNTTAIPITTNNICPIITIPPTQLTIICAGFLSTTEPACSLRVTLARVCGFCHWAKEGTKRVTITGAGDGTGALKHVVTSACTNLVLSKTG